MAIKPLLTTELVVHFDRKVCATITKQEAVDVIGRLTVYNKAFAETQDQWTAYDADILMKAACIVQQAAKANVPTKPIPV